MAAPRATFAAALGEMLTNPAPTSDPANPPPTAAIPTRFEPALRRADGERAGGAGPGVALARTGRGARQHRAGAGDELLFRAGLHDRPQSRVRPRAAVARIPGPAATPPSSSASGTAPSIRRRRSTSSRSPPRGERALDEDATPGDQFVLLVRSELASPFSRRHGFRGARQRNALAHVHRRHGARRALFRLRHPRERGRTMVGGDRRTAQRPALRLRGR